MLLDDTILPERLTPEEAREACRSLKGSTLRQEVYGLDATEAADRPYWITENNFTIRTLQRRGPNRHAAFFMHAREQVSFHYERTLHEVAGRRCADPRVAHAVTLAVDEYGNVLKSAAIGYGRRFPDPSPLLSDIDREQQARLLLTVTENDYTNALAEDDAWRAPFPSGQRVFELLNVKPEAALPGVTNLLRFGELVAKIAAAGDGLHDLAFRDWQGLGAVTDAPYRRLLKRSRSTYRANDLSRLLPPGRLEALALPGQNYALVLPGDLVAEVYRRNQPPEDLLSDQGKVLREAGYVDLEEDGNWWVPSGRIFYATEESDGPAHELGEALRHFFAIRRYRDAFGNITRVAYDQHDLAPVETTDPVGNVVRAEFDYRVLSPRLATDPNGNRSEVAFDALGFVAGTAVMGKVGEILGDSLDAFEPDLSPTQVAAFFADPHGRALPLLGGATTRFLYDVDRYFVSQKPAFAATIARETHVSDVKPGERSRTQVGLQYSDGFGRETQTKRQAARGPVGGDGADLAQRWIGAGWTIFNNKGKPVRQYEPFFTASHDFEFAAIRGVSPIVFYDPVERVVATLNPDKTFSKVVFDPWRQTSWDANDTVIDDPASDPDVGAYFRRLPETDYLPTWFRLRIDGGKGPAERAAAEQAAGRADTPAVACFDALGRIFLGIDDNGANRRYRTRTVFDVEGNRRAIVDALDRVTIRCDFAMGGMQLREAHMDAGERWLFKDIDGRTVRSWNSRRYETRIEYDALRRPVRSFARGGDPYERNARPFAGEILFDWTVYGRRDRVERAPAEGGEPARQALPAARHGRRRHHRPL